MNLEQQEIEEKQQEIQRLTDQLVDIELRFAERYIELRRFSTLIQSQLAPLYERLARWDLRVQATNQQLDRLRDIRDQVLPLPTDPFAIERESISGIAHTTQIIRSPAAPPPQRPSADFLALYHELTKRFHPDIATDEETRSKHTAIMSQINHAFVTQNIDTLQKCAQKDDFQPSTEENIDLVRLVRRVARLRSLCKTAEERQQRQENSPLAQLLLVIQKSAHEQEDPFLEIHEMLEELIDRKKFFWLNQQMRSAQLLTEVDQ
jgi:5'-deoxynucleotidase YfbR-like HD superfamily hydrolase